VPFFRFELERLDKLGESFSTTVEEDKPWPAAEKAKREAGKRMPGSRWRVKSWKRLTKEVPNG